MSQPEPQDDLQQLRDLVEVTLDRCDAVNLPHVCAMNATPQGREVVREAVLRNCIAGGMSPSSALLELEKEYSFTSLD